MNITAYTHPGCKYEENQDYYRAGRLSDDTCWLVLCDGMGGVSSGALASSLSTEFLQRCIEKQLPNLSETEEIKTFLMKSAVDCNEMVLREGKDREEPVTMGTTMVMAVVSGAMLQVVHAGDSRLYLLSRGKLKQITHDHSVVQELLDTGRITAEQANNHPNKNIITSALGVDAVTRIDYNEKKLGKGDILLCCSDGLSNMMTESDMVAILEENTFYRTAQALVQKALDAGGYDNITAIVLEV